MLIPEEGDIVTPIDDPCQFHPAWRSIVAGYLYSMGVRGGEDLKSIAMTGGITVQEDVPDEPAPKPKKGKNGKKDKKAKTKQKPRPKVSRRPVEPFSSEPKYRVFANDKWIALQIQAAEEYSNGDPPSDECVPLVLAGRWYHETDHEAAMKKRLEPLLLTGIGVDVITMDLIGLPGAQPAIEAYERLYYNCRVDDFSLNPSMQLIQKFAMPWGPLKTYLRKYEEVDEDGFVIGDGRPLAKDSDVWRAVAALMGYEALMYVWKWDRVAHGMKDNSIEHMLELSWKVSVSKLFTALFTGDIAHEDAARILAAYTAQSKKISDDRESRQGSGEGDTTSALMEILRAVAPKMVSFSESDDSARNEEIQGRIAAQLAISKTSIEDKGPQVEAEIIDAQIEEAVRS